MGNNHYQRKEEERKQMYDLGEEEEELHLLREYYNIK